ncbi:MAG: hypothetical protein IPJ13_04855 [Saprospiraceae bacterium]|nr:hypothetical protein [Saprospiraceae bacterium]
MIGEIFGWSWLLAPRPGVSGIMPSYGGPGTEFEATPNTHGEKRAFVSASGQYESLLPMDIYPQHLMKAIGTGGS